MEGNSNKCIRETRISSKPLGDNSSNKICTTLIWEEIRVHSTKLCKCLKNIIVCNFKFYPNSLCNNKYKIKINCSNYCNNYRLGT